MLKKRLTSMLLALTMVVALGSQAFAASALQSTVKECFETNQYSEYDYYTLVTELQSHSDQELLDIGYTYDDIEQLRSLSFQTALMERASLDKSVLKNYGYTENEISILKQISHGIMPMNDMSLRAVLAQCTGDFTINSRSSSQWTLVYTWTWDKAPLFLGNDSVGVSWGAYNSTSSNIDVLMTSSKAVGTCYNTITGVTYNKNLSRDQDADLNGVKYNFNMGTEGTDPNDYWVKNGSVTVTVKIATGSTAQIHYMKLCGLYGHAVMKITGSPSVTPGAGDAAWGFSFSASTSVQTLAVAKYAYYTDSNIPRQDLSGK